MTEESGVPCRIAEGAGSEVDCLRVKLAAVEAALDAMKREAPTAGALCAEAQARLLCRFQYCSMFILLAMHYLNVQLSCFFPPATQEPLAAVQGKAATLRQANAVLAKQVSEAMHTCIVVTLPRRTRLLRLLTQATTGTAMLLSLTRALASLTRFTRRDKRLGSVPALEAFADCTLT